ncbi:HAUS augmin-like complex subunit 5, partial [Narcine bancroftii]|uniref:HAUS augmin-like complex subunit 5 n=1 Tax=Narcine bancroftii TaxID=1343680 RepID=UPI0038312367
SGASPGCCPAQSLQWTRTEYLEIHPEARPFQRDTSAEEEEKRRLMDLVISLRADIQELENDRDSEQLVIDEQALTETRERLKDLKMRDSMLQAFRLQAAKQRERLQEHSRRLGDRLQGLALIHRKACQEVSFLQTEDGLRYRLWQASGPEPQVLQGLRMACDSRSSYLKLLYDDQSSSKGTGSARCSERRDAFNQQWLNQVGAVVTCHPPKHILAALENLATENKEVLLALSSQVNVVKDMEELRFSYTSSHLQDVSETLPVLRSIKSLLEEGWRDGELRAVHKVKAMRRQRVLVYRLEVMGRELDLLLVENYGHNPELLNAARELCELRLAVGESAGRHKELLNQSEAMDVCIEARNQEIKDLQQKHSRILEFQGLVCVKQDLIQALVKGNSSAKSHLIATRAEMVRFMENDLQQHKTRVRPLVEQLHNSISKEAKLFASVSLPCLDRRVLRQSQSVPVHTLSIHRMDSSMNDPQFFRHLRRLLLLPLYKAPEQLIDQATERKLEKERLQVLLGREREALESLHQRQHGLLATKTEALVSRLRALDESLVRDSVPSLRHYLRLCDQAIGRTHRFQQEVQDWWEQPAQYLVPWVTRNRMNVRSWVQRWNCLVQRSQELGRKEAARRDPRKGFPLT